MDNNWDNWGNNDNQQWNNNSQPKNDNLDDMFGDLSEATEEKQTTVEQVLTPEPVTQTTDPDPVVETNDYAPTQDTKPVKEEKDDVLFDFPEDISESFISVPGNVKSAPAFSERQVYKIINLIIIMEACREEESNYIGELFSLRGGNVKKALTLVEMDTADVEDKLMSLSTLKKILQSSTGEGIDDAMDFAIGLFARVDGLKPEQRASMISLVKSYQDQLGVKKIRANKSTPTADLIKEIREAMEGESSIADPVRSAGVIAEAVEEVVK